jgi:hypothetical protein
MNFELNAAPPAIAVAIQASPEFVCFSDLAVRIGDAGRAWHFAALKWCQSHLAGTLENDISELLLQLLHDAQLVRLQQMRARFDRIADQNFAPERNLLNHLRSATKVRARRRAEMRAKGHWFGRTDAADSILWVARYQQSCIERSEAYLASERVRMLDFFRASH